MLCDDIGQHCSHTSALLAHCGIHSTWSRAQIKPFSSPWPVLMGPSEPDACCLGMLFSGAALVLWLQMLQLWFMMRLIMPFTLAVTPGLYTSGGGDLTPGEEPASWQANRSAATICCSCFSRWGIVSLRLFFGS